MSGFARPFRVTYPPGIWIDNVHYPEGLAVDGVQFPSGRCVLDCNEEAGGRLLTAAVSFDALNLPPGSTVEWADGGGQDGGVSS